MTALEIILILIGAIMMISSFFIMEKLSPSEVNRMAELSTEEIQRILERNMKEAERKIDDMIDGVIEHSIETSAEKVERALDKEANEKILAINEYSDTVLESINKTHNEVMFLYSMLNDKHSELTNYAGKLAQLGIHLEELQENVQQTIKETTDFLAQAQEISAMPMQMDLEDEIPELKTPEPREANSAQKQRILTMYKDGKTAVEIAKKLGMGVGEVKLVIGLFREEEM